MHETRYIIRVLSDGPAPAYLLKRLPGDHRHQDADLAAPHDLCLLPARSDQDELRVRTYTEGEAIEACREWHAVHPRLDVLMSHHPTTLVLVRVDQTGASSGLDADARLLRLLPVIGESGDPVELELSVPAWTSDRADGVRRSAHQVFWRPLPDRFAAALFADVTVTRRGRDGARQVASARLLHGESADTIEWRLPCYERDWFASHYLGLHWLAAAASVMNVAQARALMSALCVEGDAIELQLHVAPLEHWLGSAEFQSGVASRPVVIEPAHHLLQAAVGVPLCWVVWPRLDE